MHAKENEEKEKLKIKKSMERGHSKHSHQERERSNSAQDNLDTSKRQARKERSARGIHVAAKKKIWTTTRKGRKEQREEKPIRGYLQVIMCMLFILLEFKCLAHELVYWSCFCHWYGILLD